MSVLEQHRYFTERLDLELKRAKRYSIFVSMIVFDLSFLDSDEDGADRVIVEKAARRVSANVRAIDNVSVLAEHKIGVLLPETPRQGAEITSRRLSEQIKQILNDLSEKSRDELIPIEMISYPDAAGAKPVSTALEELLESSRN